jgi:hypothetical protein
MNRVMLAEEKLKTLVSAVNGAWSEYDAAERELGRRPQLVLWIDWEIRAVTIEERRRVY